MSGSQDQSQDQSDLVDQSKQRIRRRMLQLRRDFAGVEQQSERVMHRLETVPEFRRAERVLFYIDARGEVRTRDAVERALQNGIRVALPYCVRDHLELAWVDSLAELVSGKFGILEPAPKWRNEPDRRASLDQIQFALVPGVAFTPHGARLGHGYGYYDRLLAQRPKELTVCGLAFQFQIVDQLPATERDVKVAMVVTDSAIYRT